MEKLPNCFFRLNKNSTNCLDIKEIIYKICPRKLLTIKTKKKMFVLNLTNYGYQSAGAGVTTLRGFTLS